MQMRQPSTRTRTATAAVIALTGLLLVALDGSAAARPTSLQKRTAGQVEALALDGSRIAYDVAGTNGPGARCNVIYVWNLRRNIRTRVSGRQTCGADTTSTGAGVRELALAGGRAAWIVNKGGNTDSGDYLYVAALARPNERILASAFRTGDVDGILTGNWLGGLVGAKSFLAVNHWATDTHGAVTSARLQRIGARLGNLTEGTASIVARSTDGRQVAVLRQDGTIGLYTTRGKLLRVVTPSSATEIAVRGDYLVVLTKTRTLEVYNSHSGRRLRSWHVASGAAHLDVSNRLASYASPHAVHVVRLATGKGTFVARTGAEIRGVQLEPPGLAYAIDGPHETGKVVFVPMSRLQPKPRLR